MVFAGKNTTNNSYGSIVNKLTGLTRQDLKSYQISFYNSSFPLKNSSMGVEH